MAPPEGIARGEIEADTDGIRERSIIETRLSGRLRAGLGGGAFLRGEVGTSLIGRLVV